MQNSERISLCVSLLPSQTKREEWESQRSLQTSGSALANLGVGVVLPSFLINVFQQGDSSLYPFYKVGKIELDY